MKLYSPEIREPRNLAFSVFIDRRIIRDYDKLCVWKRTTSTAGPPSSFLQLRAARFILNDGFIKFLTLRNELGRNL